MGSPQTGFNVEDQSRQLYLDLLKKSLTDFLHTESARANAFPLEWTIQKSPLKALRNRLLAAFLHRSHLFVSKDDRLSVAERKSRRQNGVDWPPFAETMIGLKRLDNLQMAIETLLQEDIPGDFIETGVWRGGASIFMRGFLKAHDVTNRRIWACDSFAGLPAPDTQKYPVDAGDLNHTFHFLEVGLDEVRANFAKYGLLDDQVRFVEGFFEDTLKDIPVGRLALLRLDGDMYGSTLTALETLYGKLSSGGFVIIDDYALMGCRQAVEDYRRQHAITQDMTDIDGTAVYWRKA